MTNEEAAAFVAQLQAGKRFVTRSQEEEWGLTYAGNGRYHATLTRNPKRH